MTTYVLLRDITAGELAMDSPDPDEGYGPDDVIWPKGTTVLLVDPTAWSEGDDSIEVTDAAFPNFGGYVNRGDITQSEA